jgi:hypothetical protein
MRMAVVVAGLVALVTIVGPANVCAQPEAKKRHKPVQAQVQHPAAARTSPKPDGYVERDANRLPFGSALWWDQMLRENRAGQCCN